MARLYFHARRKPSENGGNARRISRTDHCALSRTANPKYKVGFEPLLPDVEHMRSMTSAPLSKPPEPLHSL